MVSFQCEGCGDIVKKPKCKVHRCRAPFTCIDCHQTFNGTSYQSHNQCMTEDQKYQKGYKPPSGKKQQQQQQPKSTPAAQPTGLIAQLEKKKEETNKKRSAEEAENAQVEQGTKGKDSSNKKAKTTDDADQVDTKKKTKKDKKNKKKSLTEWSVDELDSDETRQLELALQYILKKDQAALSIEQLREQVVSLISSHPKSSKDIKTSTLKTKFDQSVGLTFNTKKDKITYTFIKK